MIWFVYNILFVAGFLILLPKFLWRMIRRGGYRKNFGHRLSRYDPELRERLKEGGRIWIHAVSVGEIFVAFKFMDALRSRRPELRFLISTTTSTGYALGLERVKDPDLLIYFPADLPWNGARSLSLIRPAAVLLVEGELWPNFIRAVYRLGVPLFLVNGRVSDHSFPKYRRVKAFTRRILPCFQALCVQGEKDRERFMELGAPSDRIHVFHSAKYEVAEPNEEEEALAGRLLQSAGINGNHCLLLGGSTWAGEEGVLLDVYCNLRKEFQDLVLALAPRHVERRKEILEEINRRNLTVRLRSDPDTGNSDPKDVFFIDTTGELKSFYRHADIIFIGKSLCSEGGHNIIEPALYGKPVIVGPNMSNFPVVMEDFKRADAIRQVPDVNALGNTVEELLRDPESRQRLGENAARLVREKAGAVEASVEIITQFLPDSSS
jgi:3-deoxy-D-manno-octulosonic-acid transferase